MKLQVNVTRAESKTVCTHLRASSAILKYEFSPYPRYYFIVLSTKFSGGHTTAAQFFDTHFHVTSRNQGSFTNEEREREPWEQGCLPASYSSFFKMAQQSQQRALRKEIAVVFVQ